MSFRGIFITAFACGALAVACVILEGFVATHDTFAGGIQTPNPPKAPMLALSLADWLVHRDPSYAGVLSHSSAPIRLVAEMPLTIAAPSAVAALVFAVLLGIRVFSPHRSIAKGSP